MASRKVQYFADAERVVLAGTISGMFKSARTPREDRWTGFFCKPFGADSWDPMYNDLRFSGHTSLALRKGDCVEIYAKPHVDSRSRQRDYKYWDIVDIRKVVASSTIRAAVRGRNKSVSDDDSLLPYRYFGSCAVFAMAYLEPDNCHVRGFMTENGLGADVVVQMRKNCELSMSAAVLRAAFPHAEGTNVMTGMCQYLSRRDGDANALVARVRSDPYCLFDLASEVEMRFKFETVDAVAVRDCGVAFDDVRRLRLCADRAFREVCLDAGHVCWDVSDAACLSALVAATARAAGLPSFSANDLYKLVTDPSSGFFLSEYAGRRYVYSSTSHREEVVAARALWGAVTGPGLFTDVVGDRSKVSRVNGLVCQYYVTSVGQDAPPEAYAFVHRALRSRCSVLTGGPGSGKTTAVKCLIYVLRELLGVADPRATPVLTAPTGMAAKRLKDSVNSASFLKASLSASTAAYWVCALRHVFEHGDADDDNAEFVRLKPVLENRVLVVDETSMMDLTWSCEFLDYLISKFRCSVIFIGDRDQLPSVGYGEVFEHLCMLEPDVPITTLVGSNRVSKDKHVLLENFDRVNSGHVMASLDWSEPDLFARHWFSGPSADEDAGRALVAEYAAAVRAGTSVAQVQVLTPVHNGSLGTFALNRAMQDVVNPATGNVAGSLSTTRGDEIPGASFGPSGDRRAYRVGDRVVLTQTVEDLTNGERGVVARFDTRWSRELGMDVGYVHVEFEDVVGPYGASVCREFSVDEFARMFLPAYATTIHKAQGLEYETVLMACPQAFARPGFGVRNLPFTAMTRARSRVVLFGREYAVDAAVLNRRQLRCSLLAQRVRGLVTEL